MSNSIFRFFVEKLGGTQASDYLGNPGELFYDPADGNLRLADGITLGGSIAGGSTKSLTPLVIDEDNITVDGDYIVGSDDLGKMLIVEDDVSIGPMDADLPLGSIFTIVNYSNSVVEVAGKGNENVVKNGENTPDVWLVADQSIVTVMKIGEFKWVISGPGITEA